MLCGGLDLLFVDLTIFTLAHVHVTMAIVGLVGEFFVIFSTVSWEVFTGFELQPLLVPLGGKRKEEWQQ